jgi:hypothetical protein
MFYLALIRSKLDYVSIVWNSIICTKAKKLEHIQRNFLVLCNNRFFSFDHVTYEYSFKLLNRNAPYDWRLHLDALFLFYVHSSLKCCPPFSILLVSEIVLVIYKNSTTFSFPCKKSPSGRVSAANLMCKDVDIFTEFFTPGDRNWILYRI